MFTDGRSRRVVFLAHCLLNQNAISDGTAEVPAAHREILRLILDAQVSVAQMPCPELCCLGLDRGDPKGGERPVEAENTRIRRAMGQPEASARLRELTDQVVWQIREYQKHGFAVLGIVGMDRSPCCGVNTTSDQDRELPGRGVFIASLRAALESAGLTVPVIGIKPSAPEALDRVRSLLGECGVRWRFDAYRVASFRRPWTCAGGCSLNLRRRSIRRRAWRHFVLIFQILNR